MLNRTVPLLRLVDFSVILQNSSRTPPELLQVSIPLLVDAWDSQFDSQFEILVHGHWLLAEFGIYRTQTMRILVLLVSLLSVGRLVDCDTLKALFVIQRHGDRKQSSESSSLNWLFLKSFKF